ncbi:PadR family transcriptional regulator [Actomonas aquatica]|uniref:PadR family transcriptional regulator n=1 Tax=Actomonas aquatica TaxID=2866162 RepID=A0ABZ1CA77_9BACT|nr:PadR family transcriptional regulator [Opitutus sp. WL0086]WRQ88381.1 PadR family transcriptional regulator [Opitutus sp. WL0086]
MIRRIMAKPLRNELLQGTLDLLVLQVLSQGKYHGWDVAKRISLLSSDRLTLKQGSLYPAMHRLEAQGWIAADWGVSEAGRSAKFYHLTRSGRRQLEAERAHWESFVDAMGAVLSGQEASE